jgi:hypothetical protein
MALENFAPAHLLGVLPTLREAHPRLGTQERVPGSELLQRVRTRLLQAPTASALAALASRMQPAELRATLHLIALDDMTLIRSRALLVANKRPRKDLLPLAWRLLVEHYPRQELEEHFRSAARLFGLSGLASTYQQKRVTAWLTESSLDAEITADFGRSSARDLDGWLETGGIPSRAGLTRAVWARVLTQGSAGTLAQMRQDLLVSRAATFPTAVQQAFGRHYLTVLQGRRRWAEVVLVWIWRQFGVPAKTTDQGPFWRQVPEPVRDEFRRWTQEQTLAEFFTRVGDTGGRFQFWRQYSSRWVEVYAALDDRVMVIDFGSVGVVEFAQVGNAAYVYDGGDFHRILSDNPRFLGDFKDIMRARCRILHFTGWQTDAARLMGNLLGPARRDRA